MFASTDSQAALVESGSCSGTGRRASCGGRARVMLCSRYRCDTRRRRRRICGTWSYCHFRMCFGNRGTVRNDFECGRTLWYSPCTLNVGQLWPWAVATTHQFPSGVEGIVRSKLGLSCLVPPSQPPCTMLHNFFSGEILRLICSLSYEETLGTLAQTSKQVSHIAVKVRWAHIDSMERLRHSMPSDAYTISWNGHSDFAVMVRVMKWVLTPIAKLIASSDSPSGVT